MEKVMHQTAFPLFFPYTLPKLSVSISSSPGFISYDDEEKKQCKGDMYKYCNTNLYFPNKKHYLPQKGGEKNQLKKQATVLSELRSICFAQ